MNDIFSWFPGRFSDDTRRIGLASLVFVFGGLVLAATACPNHVAPALLWSFSSFAIAAVVGFLFGIPRVLQGDGVMIDSSSAPDVPTAGPRQRYEQRVNTNLEQISDWLTKIIVGLGLINLEKIPNRLENLGEYLAGTNESLATIVSTIVVYFSSVGFLNGYLFTRLYLAGAFRRADQERQEFTRILDDLTRSLPQSNTLRTLNFQAEADSMKELAKESPHAAVLATIVPLNQKLRAIAEQQGITASQQPKQILQALRKKFPSFKNGDFLLGIYDAYNRVSEGNDDTISESNAIKLIDAVNVGIQALSEQQFQVDPE